MQIDRQTHIAKLIVAFRNMLDASKHTQCMLYRKINTVCSEIHTEHVITLYGYKLEILNVKDCGP